MLSFSYLARNLDSPLGLFIELYFDICCNCYLIFSVWNWELLQTQSSCFNSSLFGYIDSFCLFHAFEMCTKYYGILTKAMYMGHIYMYETGICNELLNPQEGFLKNKNVMEWQLNKEQKLHGILMFSMHNPMTTGFPYSCNHFDLSFRRIQKAHKTHIHRLMCRIANCDRN